jgi:hypothetical protein
MLRSVKREAKQSEVDRCWNVEIEIEGLRWRQVLFLFLCCSDRIGG